MYFAIVAIFNPLQNTYLSDDYLFHYQNGVRIILTICTAYPYRNCIILVTFLSVSWLSNRRFQRDSVYV